MGQSARLAGDDDIVVAVPRACIGAGRGTKTRGLCIRRSYRAGPGVEQRSTYNMREFGLVLCLLAVILDGDDVRIRRVDYTLIVSTYSYQMVKKYSIPVNTRPAFVSTVHLEPDVVMPNAANAGTARSARVINVDRSMVYIDS